MSSFSSQHVRNSSLDEIFWTNDINFNNNIFENFHRKTPNVLLLFRLPFIRKWWQTYKLLDQIERICQPALLNSCDNPLDESDSFNQTNKQTGDNWSFKSSKQWQTFQIVEQNYLDQSSFFWPYVVALSLNHPAAESCNFQIS